MKQLLGLFFLAILFGCTSRNQSVQTSPETSPNLDLDSIFTRLTFSLYDEVDFMVSTANSLVFYNYSKPIDTIFAYSGPYLIGRDTLIYTQLRKDTPTELMMYDGIRNRSKILELDYFDVLFSSYLIVDRVIYYWGFTDGSTRLCTFNMKSNRTKFVKIDEVCETDFYGVFYVPRIEGESLIFETENSMYTIDLNFTKIKKKDKQNSHEKLPLNPIFE